jgi:acyl carrier protein
MQMRDDIKNIFLRVFTSENEGEEPPKITDDLVLLESGMDSLGFAILVVELEEEMGFDPFTLSDVAYYPQTFGEFVAFYEANKP